MFVTTIKKSGVLVLGLVAALCIRVEASASPLCLSFSSSTLASTYPPSITPSGAGVLLSDPVGPFPLSAIMPFPWTSIDGIWSMKLPDGSKLHFSFEVQTACDGQKLMHVLGFDEKSYRVTSEGVGVSVQDYLIAGKDTSVRAIMSSSTSQYVVFVRQFRVPPGKATSRVATVVTVRPFNGAEADDVHMVARRSSPLTLSEYVEKQKQLEEKREADRRKKYRR